MDFSDAYFHIPISQRSRKYLRFHLNSQTFHCSPIGVHKGHHRSQADGTGKGYSNPPVPRQLVTESPLTGNVLSTHPDPLGPLSRPGLGGQPFKIRAGSPTGSLSRSSQTHPGEVDSSITDQPSVGTRDLLCQAVHVPNRTSDSHRKTGGVGTTSYETHSMAFKETLACPGSPGKAAKILTCSSALVVGSKQCSVRSTPLPFMSHPPTVYRRLKRRQGHTLRRLHCKRPLVQIRRRLAYKPFRTQSGFVGPKTVRAFVLGSDHPGLHRQHNNGLLHQQGGGYEVRLSLCPPLETSVMVQPKTSSVMGQTYSRSPKCHC